MTDLTVVSGEPGYHCPRCELEYDPIVINIDPYCRRCAYDIGGTINVGEDLVTEEQAKQSAGAVAKADLIKMIDNWADGFERVLGDGVNWSLAEEFSMEIIEQMLPYIDRLRKEGYLKAQDIKDLGNHFGERMEQFAQLLEQNEELMRLTGRWDDNEQEIKEYWQKKLGTLCRLPLWTDPRGITAD
jgi:hypothetical protein